MKRPLLGVSLFTVLIVLFFVWIGEVLTRISGEGARRPVIPLTAGKITHEAGEEIFWGKGKCSTCHAVGVRGNAIRAPNLGDSGSLGLPIGLRAEERALERTRMTGRSYAATDYLVESIVDPGAYVVPGFKNEMPLPWRPPISLTSDEIKAVIVYLQSLGGRVDLGAIKLPTSVETMARRAPYEEWRPYLTGDPKKGEALFFNPESNAGCAKCHAVNGKGGEVGPDLSHIAGVRPAQFTIESILDPSREIASGYEQTLITTRAGQRITGIVKKEDARAIEVIDIEARTHRVAKAEIAERVPQKVSLMPENFKEILTVAEFHDLLAFLLTLK